MYDLEERLVREHWITPNELIRAKEDQKKTKKSLFSSLIKLGYLTEEDVFIFFAANSNIPFIRLSDYCLKDDVLVLLPEDFCRANIVIPLFKIDHNLFVAMANPLDAELLINIADRTGLEINPLISSPYTILRTLDEHFGFKEEFFNMEKFIFKPQSLHKFPFHRESERIPLNIPLEFEVDDERINLVSSHNIPADTVDISRNGKALGIKTFLFIPPSVKLLLNFTSIQEGNIKAKAEVVYAKMKKSGEFLMGVKFLGIAPEVVSYLLKLAAR